MVLLVAGLVAPCWAEETKSPKTVRLLAVGNSFTQNATYDLENLVKAAGHKIIIKKLIIGGSPLQLHAKMAELHEADPKQGLYGKTDNLKDALAAEPWDIITIQQASAKSPDIETYRPYAARLRDYIKKHAPKSELLVHQTWAYRADSPRFKGTAKGFPKSRQEMHDALTQAYYTIAGELGVRVIPVGDAFNLAENDAKWGYKPDTKFDFSTAKPPALPDQTHSLHVGYNWSKPKEGEPKIGIDPNHASAAGQYLGACVWFEILYGESCVGNTFAPKKLDADYVRFLQETAHKAVTQAKEKFKREPAGKSGG